MEWSGIADLVAPPVKEEIGDSEEEREENAVGEVERERESIGGFRGGRLVIGDGGSGGGRRRLRRSRGRPPADIHERRDGGGEMNGVCDLGGGE